MVSQKQLTNIAKRWQRIASLRRKGISFPRSISNINEGCSSSSGNFVIYTNDAKRFVIPIAYISNNIIKQLFRMSEESFGLPSEGPIKLPCDSVFMEYVVTLIKRGLARDIEKALLMSMELSCSSLHVSFRQGQTSQQFPVYGY